MNFFQTNICNNTERWVYCCGSNQGPKVLKDTNGKARPCMDQTSDCEKWVKSNPENCSPKYNSAGQSENRYPFMREVCQASCQRVTNNFRADKCKKVIICYYYL